MNNNLNENDLIKEIISNGYAVNSIPENLMNSKSFIIKLAKTMQENHRYIASKLSAEFRDDKDVMQEFIKVDGCCLEYASKKLRDDEQLVSMAIDNIGYSWIFASDRLKDNKELLLKALSQDMTTLRDAAEKFRDDEEVVIQAINKNPNSITFASDRLKSRKDLALLAVSQVGTALEYLPEELRNDKEIALAAYKEYEKSIIYFGKELHKELISHGVLDKKKLELIMGVTYSDDHTPSKSILAYLESTVLKEDLEKGLNPDVKEKKIKL